MKSKEAKQSQRFGQISFSAVYPLYLAKIEKKGRTPEELNEVIRWLTGLGGRKLRNLLKLEVSVEEFFNQAKLNPNAQWITGVICGYRVEKIKDPLLQKVRYLDKLVDELAKGRAMEKILRTPL